MTGDTNAMVADNAAADANFIHATVGGNTILAQTSNVMTATAGSNTTHRRHRAIS
ncbi:MAG: hypothetical protein MZW92_32645 [Comamonadaceae bacterium]|nr:hypothetical protein [Comamonadaceae bacterium]